MKRWYQIVVGGLSAALLTAGVLPAAAQVEQEYVPAFTPEEWEIIEREYSADPPREVLTYHRRPWRPTNVVRSGGSGEDRWVLFDLGTDDSGNQYRLHSGERRVRTYSMGRQREYMFVQVFFVNPAARGSVAKRNVLMSVDCDGFFFNRGTGTPLPDDISIIAFEDFDSSGNLVETRVLSVLEANRIRGGENIGRYAAMVCYAEHSYPTLVEMLIRGQQREVPSAPSDFEIF